LDAWTFQPLSLSHSLFSDLNWYFGRQPNRWDIILQAISRLRPRRWLPVAVRTACVVKRLPELALVVSVTTALAAWAELIECAALTGWAAALPVCPPPAAMAATASAGALNAMVERVMVNRKVDVRLRRRKRDKVNFRPGTLSRAQLPPR
jgi:hypothetical protein